ncbi:hypothetical protein DTO012A8_10150 [Penicillium roqueforti]|nr:hypothetical protein DTO012A8_10150 [Penicillium roqueforti]
MHTPLRWSTEGGMPPSDLVPMSMGENMIQPVQCHYPSPSWSSADCLPYDDQVHSMHQFQPMAEYLTTTRPPHFPSYETGTIQPQKTLNSMTKTTGVGPRNGRPGVVSTPYKWLNRH